MELPSVFRRHRKVTKVPKEVLLTCVYVPVFHETAEKTLEPRDSSAAMTRIYSPKTSTSGLLGRLTVFVDERG